MKTPEQIADEHARRVAEYVPLDEDSLAFWTDAIAKAIEADRAQLVGELAPARHAIDLSHDAAEGYSNDSEIEILQDVRDSYQTIVEAVGGEWEHEPNADHMSQESWPHTEEEDE